MSNVLDQFKTQLLALSAAERAALAHFLVESLRQEKAGTGAAWREEMARRLLHTRQGQALEEVFARIRAKFA